MKQPTFASLVCDKKKKKTRRESLLAEMEAMGPWSALLAKNAAQVFSLIGLTNFTW